MKKRYCQKRERYVNNYEDMCFILEQVKENSILVHGKYEEGPWKLNEASYLVDGQRYIKITTRCVKDIVNKEDDTVSYVPSPMAYPCTWIFDKTGTENYHISPSTVLRKSNHVYKPMEICKERYQNMFKYNKEGNIENSAVPILGFNKKYDKQENYVYVYDLNSAYAAALRDKIIDTYNPYWFTEVKENQVGFLNDEDLTMITNVGEHADVVFDLIESPFREYCDELYKIKKESPKGSKEKAIAKEQLVITVGLFQNHNPYLRSYIVHTCNNTIIDIIRRHKDDITMWNTDAVYSLKPLDDIPIGDNIGEFKLEYQGLFRQKGVNYQKVDIDETSYRGVCKIKFTKEYNILTDSIPDSILPFTYDETNQIIINNQQGE